MKIVFFCFCCLLVLFSSVFAVQAAELTSTIDDNSTVEPMGLLSIEVGYAYTSQGSYRGSEPH